MGALSCVHTFAAPNGIDDFLTRGAFDEDFGLAHDGHLDSVADTDLVVEVVNALVAPLKDVGGSAFEDGPGGDKDASELEGVCPLA